MTEVKFYDSSCVSDNKLTYSVISAKFRNKWIFVRHTGKKTWEIAGGHIEKGETSFEAARRELIEETGARKFDLSSVATYSVNTDGVVRYGKLFFARIFELGPIPDTSEIAEAFLADHLPENLTYPDIQPYLYNRTLEFLMLGNRN